MKLARFVLSLAVALCGTLQAQMVAAQQASSAPVSYASMTEVSGVLAQLNQASQTLAADLEKLRVEKWKTDGDSKRQSLANVESVQRNLQNALPGMVSQLSAAPDSLNLTFKLYRNVGALYDVVANLAESAGAFGSKDEYQSLTNDSSSIERARRALADRMDKLAAAKDSEIANLHSQVKSLQAAMPPTPPKKTIIDDNEKPKNPVKKKVAKPAAAPGSPKATAAVVPKLNSAARFRDQLRFKETLIQFNLSSRPWWNRRFSGDSAKCRDLLLI
jgi:Skp family chaperone for outer membrane proteins